MILIIFNYYYIITLLFLLLLLIICITIITTITTITINLQLLNQFNITLITNKINLNLAKIDDDDDDDDDDDVVFQGFTMQAPRD